MCFWPSLVTSGSTSLTMTSDISITAVLWYPQFLAASQGMAFAGLRLNSAPAPDKGTGMVGSGAAASYDPNIAPTGSNRAAAPGLSGTRAASTLSSNWTHAITLDALCMSCDECVHCIL